MRSPLKIDLLARLEVASLAKEAGAQYGLGKTQALGSWG
jgi:hypothetical protein